MFYPSVRFPWYISPGLNAQPYNFGLPYLAFTLALGLRPFHVGLGHKLVQGEGRQRIAKVNLVSRIKNFATFFLPELSAPGFKPSNSGKIGRLFNH